MNLLSEEIQQKPQTGNQEKAKKQNRQLDLDTFFLNFIFEHFAPDLRAEPPPRDGSPRPTLPTMTLTLVQLCKS